MCDGSGWIFGPCFKCGGSGRVMGDTGNQYGIRYSRQVNCSGCGGRGERPIRPCSGCNNCKR